METKAPAPLSQFAPPPSHPLLTAYLEINQLKQLYRQGWLRHGIPRERCESVAEHSFAVALLTWWAADAGYAVVNRDRAVRMALLHELGEIYTGDLTPADGVPAPEKHRREHAAAAQVAEHLPLGAESLALWEDYAAGESPEARLVRQLDRLEMALQASVYQAQEGLNLEEFFRSAAGAIETPALVELLNLAQNLHR